MNKHICEKNAKLMDVLRQTLGLSARSVQKMQKEGNIKVNKKRVSLYTQVKKGDVIEYQASAVSQSIIPEKGDISILYEDDYILALDKPAGLNMHPHESRLKGTLANFVAHYYLEQNYKINVRFLSRLDRDTLGVVLLAKDPFTQHTFSMQAQEGLFKKIYLAHVYGHPKKSSGMINLKIGRHPSNLILRQIDDNGQEAVTRYKLIQSFERTSLLEMEAVTGRTHQLRLHSLALGLPILGDNQYYTKESFIYSSGLNLQSQQLMAQRIEFMHKGKPLIISSKQTIYLP